MLKFQIVTEHGKVEVEIKATSDPILDKLGATSQSVERAIAGVIHDKMMELGAAETRPTKWDN